MSATKAAPEAAGASAPLSPGAAPALRDRILEFRRVPSHELTPNPRNWRRHPPEQRAALDEVLAKIGIAGAVLAYQSERTGKLTLIDGELRGEHQADWPTLILDVSDDEADHLLATFDPTTLLAVPDAAALESLLADVTIDSEAMLSLLEEMAGKAAKPGATDPDDVPDAQPSARSRLGETWQLGEHRLVIGDATKAATWKALLGGDRREKDRKAAAPAVVFTDPPYGVSMRTWNDATPRIAGDGKRDLELQALVTAALRHAVQATPADTAHYIWHAESARDIFVEAIGAAGLVPIETVLWIKPSPGLGYGHYRRAHEPCLYAGVSGQQPRWYGDQAQGTVWRLTALEAPRDLGVDLGDGLLLTDGDVGLWIAPRAPKQRNGRQKHRRQRLHDGTIVLNIGAGETSTAWEVSRDQAPEHPTQKPVALARRALTNSSQPGDLAIDPFAGSGSIVIAAEQTGRRARAIELDPIYADVILERWSAFADQDPVRADGTTWSAVKLDAAIA